MAEADTKQLYPQATPLGTPIPFEIVRPLGVIKQAFTNVAASNITIPEDAGYLVLRADADCYVQLTTDIVAAVPADGTHVDGLVFVGQNEIVVIDHNAATEFSVVRAGATSGTLIVQTMQKYADVRKIAQTERM